MLNKEEIKQLHNDFYVVREGKLLGKIPFKVRSYTFGKESEFAKLFDEMDTNQNELYYRSVISNKVINDTLVSFNNKRATPEMIENFNNEKVEYFNNFQEKLAKDIMEYLKGYKEKELTEEEIEEYILSDKIIRNVTLNYDEDIKPLKFKFEILNMKEYREMAEEVQEEINKQEVNRKVRYQNIVDRIYCAHMLHHINGIEVNKNNIDQFSLELIQSILQRVRNLQDQVKDKLNNESDVKIGEDIKN